MRRHTNVGAGALCAGHAALICMLTLSLSCRAPGGQQPFARSAFALCTDNCSSCLHQPIVPPLGRVA